MELTTNQKFIIDNVKYNNISMINAFAGTGKEQPYSELILTANGWVTMGSLHINDKIIGSNGREIVINNIYEQGMKDVYLLKFCDKSTVKCGLDHLWKVFDTLTKKEKVISLREIINTKNYNNRYTLQLPKPILFNNNNLKIHPYLMGILLNNNFNINKIKISNKNVFLKLLKYLPKEDNFIQINKYEYKIINKDKYSKSKTETLLIDIYKNNIKNYIPEEYIFTSIENRKLLIEGLNYIKLNIKNEYLTEHENIAKNINEIFRSLGKYSIIKIKKVPNKNISYKIISYNKNKKYLIDITKIGIENSRCIEVSAKNNLYVTNNYNITHNTTVLREISKKYKNNSFLYLVFNKSMSDAAKKTFPTNVNIYTINGLAYKYTRDKLNLTYNIAGTHKVIHIKNHLKINRYDVAILVQKAFNIFCNSHYKDINKEVILKIIKSDSELSLIFENNKNYINDIVKHVLQLWNNMYNGELEITHNFYLKYFHLNFNDYKDVINYDYNLLDECLTEDHYVDTLYGNITIKDLYLYFHKNRNNTLVKSYNLITKRFEYKKILNAIKSENRKIYKVTFENNNFIKCTSNHPLLTNNGYKKIKEINIKKDYILTENLKYENILNIDYCGLDTVYDITVEDNHNFLCKNIKNNNKYYIVHNCQDTNDITVDIFNQLRGKKILVGDKWQSIFAFRGAVNAMNRFPESKNLYLNETFRFNKKISNKANFILNNILGEKNKIISYFPEKTIKINNTSHICRTNAGLIFVFLKAYTQGKIVKTIRNPDSIFELPLSLFYFLEDKIRYKDKITVKWLYNFKSRLDLKRYADKVQDIELLTSLKIVEDFGDKLIDIYKIAKNYRLKKNVDLYVTTAHACKGLEFDYVIVHNDFPNILERIGFRYKNIDDFKVDVERNITNSDDFLIKIIEEINLYYVTITRAISKLDLDVSNSEMFNLSDKSLNSLLELYNKTSKNK